MSATASSVEVRPQERADEERLGRRAAAPPAAAPAGEARRAALRHERAAREHDRAGTTYADGRRASAASASGGYSKPKSRKGSGPCAHAGPS